MIEAKRLLAEFNLTAEPSRKPEVVEDDGSGLVFVESKSKKEQQKDCTCYACGKKGHLAYDCTASTEAKKKEVLALMKSGEFKHPKSGVVNANVTKEGSSDDKPPENVNDCEKCVDFIGGEYFNVGVLDNEPDEDDPFGFFGMDFANTGEYGEVDPQGLSKSARVGIDLADVECDKKSGRSSRRTLEWWKAYLDSCASYHTFSPRRTSRTSRKVVAR